MADKRGKGIKAYWAKIRRIQAQNPGISTQAAKEILQSGKAAPAKVEATTETPDGLIALAAERVSELQSKIEQTKAILAAQEAELAAYKRIAILAG